MKLVNQKDKRDKQFGSKIEIIDHQCACEHSYISLLFSVFFFCGTQQQKDIYVSRRQKEQILLRIKSSLFIP